MERSERAEPLGTPLDARKDAEVVPSATTDIKRLDKKLEMGFQKEGIKPYAGSLANRALCHSIKFLRDIKNDDEQFSEVCKRG